MDNKNQDGDTLIFAGRYEEHYRIDSGKHKGERYRVRVYPMTREQLKELKYARTGQ